MLTGAVVVAVDPLLPSPGSSCVGTRSTLFVESGVIGTVILPAVYVLATIGMTRLVFFSGQTAVRRWEIVIPVLGIIVLGYTLFRNVWPLPTGVNWWGPSVAIAWLVIGIAGVVARPAATRRAGESLMRADGLNKAPATGPSKPPVEGEATT